MSAATPDSNADLDRVNKFAREVAAVYNRWGEESDMTITELIGVLEREKIRWCMASIQKKGEE